MAACLVAVSAAAPPGPGAIFGSMSLCAGLASWDLRHCPEGPGATFPVGPKPQAAATPDSVAFPAVSFQHECSPHSM